MRINNITVGADPEVFFIEQRTNVPRSAEGLLGGDKHHPVPMKGLPDGFFIQEDNVTAEFNIPPAHSMEEFTKNIFQGLKYVHKVAKDNKLKIAFLPDLDFPKDQLMTKHCQTLGCDPDFNAWTETENPRPTAPETMRTAAGHVHIGWSDPDWESVMLMARMFDLYVTVPSIMVTAPNRRRQLYGKAGACRPKPYGVECRAVDNFWLAKKSWQQRVYANILYAAEHINRDAGLCMELVSDYAGNIIDAINNHETATAQFLMEKFHIPSFKE